MVEDVLDRKGGSRKVLDGAELRAWRRFKRKFSLEDSYQHVAGHLRFSWDSRKDHRHNPIVQGRQLLGDRVLKRLDRIYNTITSRRNTFDISSTIYFTQFCII